MSTRPQIRLYQLTKKERREDPPTHLERQLGKVVSECSMLLRDGKLNDADQLFRSQSSTNQDPIRETCDKKRHQALQDQQVGGRVLLASERKAIEKGEKEKGAPLTKGEIDDVLVREQSRPRHRKNKPDKVPKSSKKEKARRGLLQSSSSQQQGFPSPSIMQEFSSATRKQEFPARQQGFPPRSQRAKGGIFAPT